MAGTVVAVFDTHEKADRAAHALVDAGVVINDISIVRKDASGERGSTTDHVDHPIEDHEEYVSGDIREVPVHDVTMPVSKAEEAGPRAVVGVVTGAPIALMLVASSVLIPGVGPLFLAGPFAAMMVAMIGGGAVGGLVGALTAGGIPEEVAQRYHTYVENGSTLVAALSGKADEQKIEDVLRQHGGHDVSYLERFIDSVQSIES